MPSTRGMDIFSIFRFICGKLLMADVTLSNDPGKKCTIFYCSAAITFPTLKRLCFQTKNLSTDGKQVYKIKCI